MTSDLRVGMAITAEDRGATSKLQQTSRAAEREAQRVNRQSARDADQAANAQERAAQRARSANERMYADRERLGIRSEQRIQREIALTEAAYQRLARTGQLSANEQGRAFAAMQQRVQGLRREMQGAAEQQSRIGRGVGLAGRGLSAYQTAAGVAIGAGYSVAQPVRRAMEYDSRLASMANTAFSDRDVAGRRAGMRELDQAIRRAVSIGGGKPDQAADTLDALLASGALPEKSAINLLPTLQKASVATGANPTELAQIAIRGMQTFGISEADIPKAIDMAVRAGQAGGFEIRDMAKWLPQQMAAARSAGMSGLGDFGKLLTANQASIITAGTPDEAGNNLVNLLAKLSSRDTITAASKIQIAPGKSIDLVGTLSAAREKGIDPLTAFGGVVNRVMAADPRYQALQTRLKSTTNSDERQAIYASQADLLQGASIGKILPDRQASMGLIALLNNQEYMRTVQSQTMNGSGGVESNHALIEGTASYQLQRADNTKFFAEMDSIGGTLGNVVGDVAKKLADYGDKYPKLAEAIVSATGALNALAAAAAAASVIGMLRSGSGAAAAGRAGAAATAAGRGGWFAKGAGAAALVYGGEQAWEISQSDMTPAEKDAAYVRTAGGSGGAFSGAVAGARMGSAFGPWGAAIGGVGGGLVGGFLGDNLGDWLGKKLFNGDPATLRTSMVDAPQTATGGYDPEALRDAMIAARNTPQKLDLNVKVDVQDGNIVAAVNEANSRNARRQ